jgi:hypothetical protein
MRLAGELVRGAVPLHSLSAHLLLAGSARKAERRTAFCAKPARRKKAFATSTALSSPFASLGINFSAVVSVILTSASVRICLARGIVLRGIDGISGRTGSRAAMLASR